jgi:predicted DNA-binding WGR domain protein
MSRVRWTGAPDGLRSTEVRLENVALVPASLMPHKRRYQALANDLPAGSILVVLPEEDTPERRLLEQTADRFRAKGHPVAVLTADQVLGKVTKDNAPASAATTTAAPATPPSTDPVPPAPSSRDTPLELPPFAQELRLVSIDESRNRARFYVLQWHPTLWGGLALVRVWGRIGSAGRAKVLAYADSPTLDAALTRTVRRRLRHGYQVVDWH